jgi:hypothetical protein
MHETYRMLGREREADLEREAAKWRLAERTREREPRRCEREIIEEPEAKTLLRTLIFRLRLRARKPQATSRAS